MFMQFSPIHLGESDYYFLIILNFVNLFFTLYPNIYSNPNSFIKKKHLSLCICMFMKQSLKLRQHFEIT